MIDRVPDGWKLKTIGEIGNVVTGSTPSTQQSSYWGGEIPFISPADFTGRVYVEQTERTLTEAGAEKSRLLPKNSILVTCIGSLGGMAMSPKASVTNQQINAVVADESQNSRFHFYNILFNIHELIKSAGTTTLPIINKSTFSQINILFPPLPEQKIIAAILSSVDEMIEKTRAQIDKLKDLKTGMMQELLTKGIGHTEFKDSPVGRIPVNWNMFCLEHLVNPDKIITYGIVQAGPHHEGGIPYIRVSDMTQRYLGINGMLRTSPAIALKYKRSSVSTGDIVYALRGVIGHVQLVPPELEGANLTQGTARISPNERVNSRYLLWAMKSPFVQLQNDLEAKGSTFKEITLASLRKLQITLPPLEEQEVIASVMDSVERKLFSAEDRLEHFQNLKKALMQDLLTGKVRVQVDTRELADA